MASDREAPRIRRHHKQCGLVLTAVLVENVVDLLLDSLAVVLTLGTALALVIPRNVDKGVTMHVVDSRLNRPQTARGLQCVVYLEARFGGISEPSRAEPPVCERLS